MDTIFKALSDKNRRKILEILKKNDMTVNQIADHFSITGASLSHHLDILKRARLVISEREGQYIRYSLNTSVFEEMIKLFMNLFGKEKYEKN
jgi:ArsR family transcriptional regulator, arsenate/arsenite/antimonite-responsive transcriptional repressor